MPASDEDATPGESRLNDAESGDVAMGASDHTFTIGQLVRHIAPQIWKSQDVTPEMPNWPPDVFAIVGSILERSGAYTQVIANWPPYFEFDADDLGIFEENTYTQSTWSEWIRFVGYSWRVHWPHGPIPKILSEWWEHVVGCFDIPIASVCEDDALCQSLLQLSAASDEACYGVGTNTPFDTLGTEPGDELWTKAEDLLASRRDDTSLCLVIDPGAYAFCQSPAPRVWA